MAARLATYDDFARRNRRRGIGARGWPGLVAVSLAVLLGFRADASVSEDADLAPYAVEIVKRPGVSWHGYGVYLGQGLILTAAHVVPGHREAGPMILIAGRQLQGTVIKY